MSPYRLVPVSSHSDTPRLRRDLFSGSRNAASTHVSVESGGFPFWSPDGRRLYYVPQETPGDTVRLMEVEFDGSGAEPVLGYVIDEEIPGGEEQPDTKGIVIVENWLTRFLD
jgi:hypothetical protein